VTAIITKIKIARTNDCVCVLVQILHALFEAPQTADATFQATLCAWILATFTSEMHNYTVYSSVHQKQHLKLNVLLI